MRTVGKRVYVFLSYSLGFLISLFFFTNIQDRLEIIIDSWISSGYVPSPEEVSKDEEINFMWRKGKASFMVMLYLLFTIYVSW